MKGIPLRQELEQRPRGDATSWLAPPACSVCFFKQPETNYPGVALASVGLGSSRSNQENAAWTCYRPVWWEHLLGWSLLFAADQTGTKLTGKLTCTLHFVQPAAGLGSFLCCWYSWLFMSLRTWETVLRHHLFYTQHCILTFRKVAIPIVYGNTLNAGFTSMLNFRDIRVKFSRFCLPLLPYIFLFFLIIFLSVSVGFHCVGQASLELIYFRTVLDLNYSSCLKFLSAGITATISGSFYLFLIILGVLSI